MKYIPMLTEDEVRYVCSVIPTKDAIAYFRQNQKMFGKICPGFRVSAVSKLNVGDLLFRNRNIDSISSFIEGHINDWIFKIQKDIDKCIEDGNSKELAYIHTLPFCFFAGNVNLYFKLTGEEWVTESIELLSSAVVSIKEAMEKQKTLQEELDVKKSDINQLQKKIDSGKLDKKILKERSVEIKTLKHDNVNIARLEAEIKAKEKTISELRFHVQEIDESMQRLSIELSKAKNDRQSLEIQIRTELEERQVAIAAKKEIAKKPLRPENIDDFKDYLGYNLENIGVPTDVEYCLILKEHLSSILFQGLPIVVSRNTSVPLMKCIANALIGTPDVKTLAFRSGISEQTIDEFLSTDWRILCLDNFLGNFNETILFSMCDKHKDKIIFITIAYDRTLCFMPDEFLKYCHYLNVNHIEAFLSNTNLTEDPSTIEEAEAVFPNVAVNSRYSSLLREILGEFGIRKNLIERKCALIANEQDLCRFLAFDILPYCVDVLLIMPYNTSERLVKYAGNNGKCPQKNLFMRWFA
ncbi:MAG: hypothetical protein LBT29_06200 [Flavobacteriaceae bacterium]|jgi:hypothetical protein|nr:hypothetical protein [Flavobacteriaceae bacterium]